MNTLKIGRHTIGENHPVYVIAEIGINHDGDFSTAKKMIQQAHQAGASAAKLQTYITEKRVPKDSPIFGILKQCELSFDQQKKLFEYGKDLGIDVFSTPFDDESVDFLDSVNTPCFKIASFDLVNHKLLKAVTSKKKPIILSRGMASQSEIDTAITFFKKADVPFALLHCVSAYPIPSTKDLNLSTLWALRERYQCPVGFSDHTIGIEAPIWSVFAGATLIEKHFTYSKKATGPDHAMSTEPQELKQMVEGIRRATEGMGTPAWKAIDAEAGILQYRRPSSVE